MYSMEDIYPSTSILTIIRSKCYCPHFTGNRDSKGTGNFPRLI